MGLRLLNPTPSPANFQLIQHTLTAGEVLISSFTSTCLISINKIVSLTMTYFDVGSNVVYYVPSSVYTLEIRFDGEGTFLQVIDTGDILVENDIVNILVVGIKWVG